MERQPVICFPQARTSVIVQKQTPSSQVQVPQVQPPPPARDNSCSDLEAEETLQRRHTQEYNSYHERSNDRWEPDYEDEHQQQVYQQNHHAPNIKGGVTSTTPSTPTTTTSRETTAGWMMKPGTPGSRYQDTHQEQPGYKMEGHVSHRPSIIKRESCSKMMEVDTEQHKGQHPHDEGGNGGSTSCHQHYGPADNGGPLGAPPYQNNRQNCSHNFGGTRHMKPGGINNPADKYFHHKDPAAKPRHAMDRPAPCSVIADSYDQYQNDQARSYHQHAGGLKMKSPVGHNGSPPGFYHHREFKSGGSPPYPLPYGGGGGGICRGGYSPDMSPPYPPQARSPRSSLYTRSPHGGGCYPSPCNKSCCMRPPPTPSPLPSPSIHDVMQMAAAAAGNPQSYQAMYKMIYKQAVADVCAAGGAKTLLRDGTTLPPSNNIIPPFPNQLTPHTPLDSMAGGNSSPTLMKNNLRLSPPSSLHQQPPLSPPFDVKVAGKNGTPSRCMNQQQKEEYNLWLAAKRLNYMDNIASCCKGNEGTGGCVSMCSQGGQCHPPKDNQGCRSMHPPTHPQDNPQSSCCTCKKIDSRLPPQSSDKDNWDTGHRDYARTRARDQFSPPPSLPQVSPGSLLRQDTSPRNLYYSQNLQNLSDASNDMTSGGCGWGNNGDHENSKWSASPSLDGIRSMDDKFGASSSPFLAAPAVKKDDRPGVLQRSSGKTESNSCSIEMPPYLGGKSVATSHYTSSGQDAEMQDVSGKPTDSSYLTINEKAISPYDQNSESGYDQASINNDNEDPLAAVASTSSSQSENVDAFNQILDKICTSGPMPELYIYTTTEIKKEVDETEPVLSSPKHSSSQFPVATPYTNYDNVDSAWEYKPNVDAIKTKRTSIESVDAAPIRERKRRTKSEIENGQDKRPISDCRVCGDKAIAHMHYGGICCYSCKAFFRRAVQSGKDKKYRCKADGSCNVSVNNRRGCQKCRFEKCLQIGMVPSWVLSDEQCEKRFGKSKLKRKGGYPNIKREPSPVGVDKDSLQVVGCVKPVVQVEKGQIPENMRLTDTDELSIEYMSCVYEASKEMISFSEENTELWKKLFSNEATKKHEYNSTEFTEIMHTFVMKNIFFLEANSFFKKLDYEDKRALLRKNMAQIGQLRGALGFNTRDKKFDWYFNQKEKPGVSEQINTENQKIDEQDLGKFYNSQTTARSVKCFMEKITSIGLTSEAILILMHVVIFSTDGLAEKDLLKGEFIEQVQVTYFNLLHRYIISTSKEESPSSMMSKIMKILVELRQLCDQIEATESTVSRAVQGNNGSSSESVSGEESRHQLAD